MEPDEEEYSIEGSSAGGGSRKLLETPEGLKRRRARRYYDRTDCRGKCLHASCSAWSWFFLLQGMISAAVIVGCGVVAEYIALKQGKSFELAVVEGWTYGVLCYTCLYAVSEIGYKCSDEKTTRRGIKDETSLCSLVSYFLTLVLFFVLIGVFAAVNEYCVEGVSCRLPPALLYGGGGGSN